MKHLTLILALVALPAYANGTKPEPPAPEPEPPTVEQPTPEPEPRAEEDNWTCRNGLHRHENRTHLCVEKRKPNRAAITDQTYYGGKAGEI
jgi:hypothetical protein